jgi:hypothetical protein
LPVPESARERIRLDFEGFQRPLANAFFDRGGTPFTIPKFHNKVIDCTYYY